MDGKRRIPESATGDVFPSEENLASGFTKFLDLRRPCTTSSTPTGPALRSSWKVGTLKEEPNRHIWMFERLKAARIARWPVQRQQHDGSGDSSARESSDLPIFPEDLRSQASGPAFLVIASSRHVVKGNVAMLFDLSSPDACSARSIELKRATEDCPIEHHECASGGPGYVFSNECVGSQATAKSTQSRLSMTV